MTAQKQKIIKLLEQNYLISEVARKKIIDHIDELSKSKLKMLEDLLQKGVDEQQYLMKKYVKSHPDFLGDLKSFAYQSQKKSLSDRENKSKASEEAELLEIENQLNNL